MNFYCRYTDDGASSQKYNKFLDAVTSLRTLNEYSKCDNFQIKPMRSEKRKMIKEKQKISLFTNACPKAVNRSFEVFNNFHINAELTSFSWEDKINVFDTSH